MWKHYATEWGTLEHDPETDRVTVYGSQNQRALWAARWPCSRLRHGSGYVEASFDANGDLVALEHPAAVGDLGGDELSAWTTDVLREAGFGDHPACRN